MIQPRVLVLIGALCAATASAVPTVLDARLVAAAIIFTHGFETQNPVPPDPATIAPPLSETGTTSLYDGTAFLWNGPDAIQEGVAPGTIDPERVAVLYGGVRGRTEDSKPGVLVRVRDHPEFGFTRTRMDGRFDLVVNGGQTLILEFILDGHLPAQRPVDVPWQNYHAVPDVALIALDSQVTMVDLDAPMPVQSARGTPTNDGDGTRQATVMFPQGTTADMVLPDGSIQPLTSLAVRATEYTVGDRGPESMPAPLPPASAYTYAVELSVDAALEAGADSVIFSQPLPFYVENFVGFPVGSAVPVGIYDRTIGAWVPQPNGTVIKIVGEGGGLVDIDTDGDDIAESSGDLEALGITTAERQELASLYDPGETLWRAPVSHFSPVDCNWPSFPDGAGDPQEKDPKGPYDPDNPDVPDDDPDGDCNEGGSIIYCERQVLGEVVQLAGTPEALHYVSDRVPGRRDPWEIAIPLTDATVPDTLDSLDLTIDYAGRQEFLEFDALPNLSHPFAFDGLDAYQRRTLGAVRVSTQIRYFFPITYADGEEGFSQPSRDNKIGLVPGRQDVAFFSSRWDGLVGGFDARALGLGGWSLTSQHFFDPLGKIIYLGDGRQRRLGGLEVFRRIAGTGQVGYSGDGGPALDAEFDFRSANQCQPLGIDVAADGTVYVADTDNLVIRAITPDGTVDTVSEILNVRVQGIDVAADGSIYVAQPTRGVVGNRVVRVLADGSFEVVAGDSPFGFSGDGGPATEAQLAAPVAVVVGPAGSLYIADTGNFRIRRVDPGGIISTFAGTGTSGSAGDGGPAVEAQLGSIGGMAFGPDGSLYVSGCDRVRKIDPNGIISTVAGGGSLPTQFNPTIEGLEPTEFDITTSDLEVGPDGTLYFAWIGLNGIAAVGEDGILKVIAGKSTGEVAGEGGHPRQATIGNIRSLALAPDGRLVFADAVPRAVFSVSSADIALGGDTVELPGAGGGEIYVFDSAGRHLQTLHGLTRGLVREFSYDSDGRLAAMSDAHGNTLTVHRDGVGKPFAIEAPSGQTTTLDVNAQGYLSSVTNPLGHSVSLSYKPPVDGNGGLLATLTDERNMTSNFTFDDRGRLLSDTNALGDAVTLTRSEIADGVEILRTSSGKEDVTFRVEVKNFAQDTADGQGEADTRVRTVTTAGGAVSVQSIDQAGNQKLVAQDGTEYRTTIAADPRWGTLAPYVGQLEVKKGAATVTLTTERSIVFDANAPGGVGEFTATFDLEGQVGEIHYDAASLTRTATSAEGFQQSLKFNAFSKITEYQADSSADPWLISYDALGRYAQWDQGGGKIYTFAYDPLGRLASLTTGAGDVLEYTWDDADRLVGYSAAGDEYTYGYDNAGNLTSVSYGSPERTHLLEVDDLGDALLYTPPGGIVDYERVLGPGGLLQEIHLPSGRTQTFSHDASSRTTGVSYPEADLVFTFSGTEDIVQSATRTPTGVGAAQGIDYAYDRGLITQAEWTGAATGTFDYSYDGRLHLSAIDFSSGVESQDFAVTVNPDGRIAMYGPFLLTRNGPGGAVSEISDGTLSRSTTYDGQLRATEQVLAVNALPIYGVAYAFDAANVVSQKTETLMGVTKTYGYEYDAMRRLDRVLEDGVEVEAYAYDAAGNRVSAGYDGGAAEIASYDGQDRLDDRNGVDYVFDADGFLASRGADSFTYSATGELLTATVGGVTVDYDYDTTRRRVARSDAGGTTEYFYGNPTSHLELTAARDPGDVWSYYFYDDNGFAYAMQRGSSMYYIGTDAVGSPRVVVDDIGTVMRVIEYDAFGRVTMDTAPGFMLHIGYAGGLADPLTGLVRFGVRDYEPESGRWTARDPILFHSGQANLYAYVHNRPVALRDPAGLFCTGGSFYRGIGGGVKQCWDDKGFSMCSEAGIGTGLGLDFNPFGDLDPNFSGTELSGGLSAGPVGGGVEQKHNNLKDCEPGETKFKAQLGPVEVDLEDLSDPKFDGKALFDLEADDGGPKAIDLNAKFAWKECVQVEWWW